MEELGVAERAVEWLRRYVQLVHDSPKGTIRRAKYGILGVQQKYPHLKGHLQGAWELITAWQLTEPAKHRLPMPEELMEALFSLAVIMGVCADSPRANLWLPLAVLLRAGFYGLLRPGEIYALQRAGVALPGQRVRKCGRRGVLTILEPKNRRFAGIYQFAVVDDDTTLAWLNWLCEGLPRSAKLFPLASERFRWGLRFLLDLMGLGHLGFVPASLRTGGATARFFLDQNVGALRFQGRWRSDRGLENYLQEAVVALVWADVEPAGPLIEKLLEIGEAFRGPPAQSWSHYFDRAAQYRQLLKEVKGG